ncbi:electron transfer flavoprotein-associated cytochrome b and CCG domain pair iron-sulfur cluster-binding oxidoreductase [Geobacter metallireducens GS-15]|uniref:Electron transfer flavoprotein-associated cytochrome b and CCG domain pair iron-sulfur cluster-binding oxidoreductase n=1 Tax=Geobacter metallireducens (strain ATCC 53774 / DSM 7210 / GS-15) TaxID=269799 RepID=Q39TD4_GEOMG|nr:heterodisulfide reductase-related iron-sulfur binding cluster [Geobacter metallireducens]ABB32490.1 electron transfer flavoprotein-associated cytochrome b and CCG domain pair iron-sulfur cluster-binding oxidoreductase [Geobacter metallireducens GS-15]
MEATREIYWNIGHGVVLPMYVLSLAAVAMLVWGFWKQVPLYRVGRPLDRCDRYDERVKRMVGEVLGQVKVSRVTEGGLFHSLFFWGFLTLFVGTLLVMVQADFFTPLMHVNLLSGEFYKAFSLVLDLAGLVAILMLAGLFVRRFITKPEGLEIVKDDYIIHQLLFAILITGFIIEGARMAATELTQNPGLARFSPVGYVVAQLFVSFDEASIKTTHKVLWWLHFALVLGFFCAIPYSKLRHILTTSLNAFFAPLEPMGTIGTINLEDESIEQFGAAKVTDLTWKDIFDADACTSCKRCQERCPAYATGKPLSPMKVIQQVGEVAENDAAASLCDTVGQDVLWSCTTCRACQDICPANNEHVNKILEMRRNLTLMEGAFPGDEVRTAIGNIEVNGNPFGLAFAARGEWSDNLPVTLMESGEEVDILYFVGCYASFDKRNREIAKSFITICQAAGIKVGILGKEEKCCGEPARKLGNEYLYQMTAQENIELIKGYGVKKIVTTCPHCFNTLGRDYKDLGLDIPVEHYSTYLHGLLKSNRLNLTPAPFVATYHDSCYVGRYMDIIEEPRSILKQAGGQLREMEKSGGDSFCCGAGGGRILAEEKLGTKISEKRVAMAQETEAPLLVSNCPFCLTMFEDGIKTGGAEGSLVAKDLAEIVVERLGA